MINFSSFIFLVFSSLLFLVLYMILMFLFLIVVASIPQYFLTFWNIKLELPFISNYLLSWILGSFWALYSIKILRLIIRNEKAGFSHHGMIMQSNIMTMIDTA